MRIDEKIEKYLITEKVDRKKALDKMIKTIKSVKTDAQADVAEKMIRRFYKMYGEGFFDLGVRDGATFEKLMDKLSHQKDIIKYLEKLKKNSK